MVPGQARKREIQERDRGENLSAELKSRQLQENRLLWEKSGAKKLVMLKMNEREHVKKAESKNGSGRRPSKNWDGELATNEFRKERKRTP